jgi:dihydropyrimidinase
MAFYDLIILNGLVVTDTEIVEKDIAIKDEIIAEVVPKGMLLEATAKRTIDAKGGYVMVSYKSLEFRTLMVTDTVQPGGIDAHCHLAVRN